MELKDLKITDGEISSLNVKSAADTYYSTDVQNNKNIFDKLPEHIAEKHNALIEALTENGQPVQSSDVMLVRIGESGDLQISADGVQWQNVADNALEKKADSDDVYTKEETDEAIAEKITAIGAGDMAMIMYDSDFDGIVDNAQRLGGRLPEEYASADHSHSPQDVGAAAADHTHTAADVGAAAADHSHNYAASSHNQSAATITAGTFPGNVIAYETARTTRSLFNNETRASSTTGTLKSVKYFIDVT